MPFSNQERRQDRLHWLAEMYSTYASDLQRAISNKVGDPPLAEDLTSTVFLKALRWLSEDQSAESVRGWLYATARTTIIDHWQAQRLLSLLPERDRTILTLRYLQGYSAAEIATALGTSAGHIRVLQLRALRRAAHVETMERNRYRMQEQESPFDSFATFLAPESRRVLDLAREEMLALSHWWLGTEHVLWGLASEESLSSFLTPLLITPERIHAGIVFIFDRQTHQGPSGSSSPPLADVSSDALKLLTPAPNR
jgi:DNA-directed RNA polymerase specialized sigma24 family protein